nr:hypothetical protein [uncultured Flavobacterium sp.]
MCFLTVYIAKKRPETNNAEQTLSIGAGTGGSSPGGGGPPCEVAISGIKTLVINNRVFIFLTNIILVIVNEIYRRSNKKHKPDFSGIQEIILKAT